MGRRKLAEENIRKIIKVGSSYGVTLPISQIKKLGWKEGQKVTIDPKGQSLVISFFSK